MVFGHDEPLRSGALQGVALEAPQGAKIICIHTYHLGVGVSLRVPRLSSFLAQQLAALCSALNLPIRVFYTSSEQLYRMQFGFLFHGHHGDALVPGRFSAKGICNGRTQSRHASAQPAETRGELPPQRHPGANVLYGGQTSKGMHSHRCNLCS